MEAPVPLSVPFPLDVKDTLSSSSLSPSSTTPNIGVSSPIVKSMISVKGGKGEEGLEAGGKSNAGRLAEEVSWLVFSRNLVIN